MNELLNNQSVRRSVIAVLVLLAVFLLAKSINEFKVNSTIGKTDTLSTISVFGDGEVTVTPDIATFSFGVSEDADDVASAQNTVSTKVSKILDSLEDMGIKEKDIKTLSYNIYPRYNYFTKQRICSAGSFCPPTQERELVGYTVSQTISVKLRDINKAGEVLGSLGGLAVSNLNGPNFDIEDRDELMRESRKMAIDDAKGKAKQLSKDLGVKLVRVVSFSEGENFDRFARFESAVDNKFGIGAAVEPEIPVGESQIKSSVVIVYEIR